VYVVLVFFHVLACLAIIGIVLLQSGKGAEIGTAFGGGGSQAVFGSMGTPTILGKITTGVAVLFTLTSFGLALLSSRPSTVVPATAPPPAAAPAASAPATPAAPAGSPAPAPAR
jgi:preprotein translocase subunit SecG